MYQSSDVFLTANREPTILYSITAGGIVSEIGPMDHVSKGMAFDCAVPPAIIVPTISEWGMIAMAMALGVFGFMVLRRRKVNA